MRGRLYEPLSNKERQRLTPANAGTTRDTIRKALPERAHPRECGDDAGISSGYLTRLGSPPRMRGRHRPTRTRRGRCRLTPANAGTTGHVAHPARSAPAHPRECGDDGPRCASRAKRAGSPPRMRGRLMRSGCWRPDRRLTPANAGTTRVYSFAAAIAAAHPRECGDDL